MLEPKLLAAAELLAIRERAKKDEWRLRNGGWPTASVSDRQKLLGHIDALALVADYTHVAGELLCTHCGARIHSLEEAQKHDCREQDLPFGDEAARPGTP